MDFCVPLEDVSLDDLDRVGGKTASLGEMIQSLSAVGVRVPGGFAVTAAAYDAVLDQGDLRASLRRLFEGFDEKQLADLARRGAEARSLIRGAGLPAELAAAIDDAYAGLGDEPSVAVRSSATAEDLPHASFAGQQASFLNVQGAARLREAVLDCLASVFTDRAITYRVHHGFDHFAIKGAVAVQRMVRSDLACAGVAFTLDPDTGFREVVVLTGAWGLGENVVAGRVDPDEVQVFKPKIDVAEDPIISRSIGHKQTRIVYARRGGATTKTLPVSRHDRERRCFSDAEAVQLARWCVAIEKHYSSRRGQPTPMDIEWAKDGESGELFIVQARPETVRSRQSSDVIARVRVSGEGELVLTGAAIGSDAGFGKARVITHPDRLPEFQAGEVLVADMTDPDWVPAIRVASAVVTNRGGRTCHAAIVSRELGVPCIVGAQDATERLAEGEVYTVSCAHGSRARVTRGAAEIERDEVSLESLPRTRTKVMAIVANPEAAFLHASLPVAGVGLVRQEFVVANHIGVHPMACLHPERLDESARERVEEAASQDADPAAYFVRRLREGVGTLAAAFYPRPVIVRLGDFKSNEYRRLIGGETFEPIEENPMIGLRGASRYLHPDFAGAFELECRALAQVRGSMGLDNVHLMVPFCRTADEGRQVVEALEGHGLVRGESGLQLWVMCELPSNVMALDEFAEVFDGFSIGSNDLTQLVLGVDRDSAELSHLFDESQSAVKRTIAKAIADAKKHGRPIGLCGQAPSDKPEFAAFLVEAGIDSISLTPDAVFRAISVIARAESEAGAKSSS
jgi:pyruvate,water dikinase